MKKHGKKYREVQKLLEVKRLYPLDEAVVLLKKTSTSKFDASCEIHVRLGIDASKGEQMVRSSVVLPYGTGKKVKVIAFVSDDRVKEATDAGAMEAGCDELIEKISKGWIDFDVAVAMPDVMKKLGKIAKTLGQKGLMPNPKAGTVSSEPAKVIEELNRGKIEFRTDKLGITHNVIGKVSYPEDHLVVNVRTYLKNIQEAKPAGIKGTYIRSVALATTMGPGIKVEVQSILK